MLQGGLDPVDRWFGRLRRIGGGRPRKRLREFQARNKEKSGPMLERLQQAVIDNQNVFAVLVDAVRVCSLGQITHALFEVGGQYRRSM
jgi:methylmalonyl-CoA mutase